MHPNAAKSMGWLMKGALFFLTALPICFVLYRSVMTRDGATLEFYREAYGASAGLRAIVNTLVISIATVVFSLAIAIPAAWLVTRTDLPGQIQVKVIAQRTILNGDNLARKQRISLLTRLHPKGRIHLDPLYERFGQTELQLASKLLRMHHLDVD